MRTLFPVLLSVFALAFAVPAAADRPTVFAFELSFPGVDTCTGLVHTVTIAGTEFVHFHDGRVVSYAERTITTTPTGYVGHGTDTDVFNGQIFMNRFTDILANESGDRFRASFVFVLDLSTGTVRVEKGIEVTCLGP
jgi:hypothetical protein